MFISQLHIFFEEMSTQILCLLFHELFVCMLLSCKSSLYILDISPLSYIQVSIILKCTELAIILCIPSDQQLVVFFHGNSCTFFNRRIGSRSITWPYIQKDLSEKGNLAHVSEPNFRSKCLSLLLPWIQWNMFGAGIESFLPWKISAV